jgi:hypothetical protein
MVPAYRRGASRLPGYRASGTLEESLPVAGYDHWSKSRRVETLLGYGNSSRYSLQEIRDAHVFAIASLSGPHSPAIAMVDRAILSIATKVGADVKVGFLPAFEQFAIGRWRYAAPSREMTQAMSIEDYIRQRFLIHDRVAHLNSSP